MGYDNPYDPPGRRWQDDPKNRNAAGKAPVDQGWRPTRTFAAGRGDPLASYQADGIVSGIHQTELGDGLGPYGVAHAGVGPSNGPVQLQDAVRSTGNRPYSIRDRTLRHRDIDNSGWMETRLPTTPTHKKGGSGPSVGATQTDFGQHPDHADELVAAMLAAGYFQSADDASKAAETLKLKGEPRVIFEDNLGFKINHFLNTPDGRAMVDRWDDENGRAAVDRVAKFAIGVDPLRGRGVLDPSHPDHLTALKLLGAVANNRPGRGDGYNWSHAFAAIRRAQSPTLDDIVRELWEIPEFKAEGSSGRNILTKLGLPIPVEIAEPEKLWIPDALRRKPTMPPAEAQTAPVPLAPAPPGGPADAMPPLLAPPGGPTGPGPLGTSLPAGRIRAADRARAAIQPRAADRPRGRRAGGLLVRRTGRVPVPRRTLARPGVRLRRAGRRGLADGGEPFAAGPGLALRQPEGPDPGGATAPAAGAARPDRPRLGQPAALATGIVRRAPLNPRAGGAGPRAPDGPAGPVPVPGRERHGLTQPGRRPQAGRGGRPPRPAARAASRGRPNAAYTPASWRWVWRTSGRASRRSSSRCWASSWRPDRTNASR